MKSNRSSYAAAVTLLIGAALPGAVSAQSTWNVYNGSSAGSGCSQNATNSGNFGNTWACTGVGTAGTAMTASAFSTQVGSSGTLQVSGSAYANAYLSSQGNSGFGAANRSEGLLVGSPNHAVDNLPASSYDMVLLNFTSGSYVLDKIGVGWTSVSAGADITVLRWSGGVGGPTTGTGTVTTGGNKTLASSGWTLVGSYKDLTADSTLPFGDTAAARSTGANPLIASSWWLVSAFNTALNGSSTSCKTAAGTVSTCDEGDDAFKFNFVKTILSGGGGGNAGVPEPASMALAALALLGIYGTRRSSKGQTA